MEYLLKSSALLIVFYICYKFLLQRDTFFQTNRWFLLSGLIISFCLPFIVIPIYITKKVSSQFFSLDPASIIETTYVETAFNWFNVFAFIYIIGIIFLSLRFISQLLSLSSTLSKGSITKQDGYIFVETKDEVAPFSFFNYIVFNPSNFDGHELEHIIRHEKVHANQNHSIDILIAHLASIICWFNPFIWLYKKNLQQNLEFIADNEALSKSNCRKTYQYVLLKTSVPNYQMALTNNFYNSLIKKRIVMLHKNKSKKRNQFKTLLILPVLAVFLMSFSTKEIISYESIEDNSLEEVSKSSIDSPSLEMKDEKLAVVKTTENSTNPLPTNTAKTVTKKETKGEVEIIVITKDMSDDELKAITARLKEDGMTLKFKGIKRNKNNEIIAIQIQAKSKNSNASISETQDDAINPITIKIEDGSISIGTGHDSGHRDYVYETHDGKTKIHKSHKNKSVFVYSNSDSEHGEHEVIEDNDKIIIKSGGTIKEIKKGKKGKSIWVTSDDEHGEHEVIEIDEDGDGNAFIIKDKGGKLIKSTGKNLWISDDDEEGETILELKKGDNNLFISSDDHGKQPLFIIDGKEKKKGSFKNIDPNNIESINVLKGKAAIKKYGKKGKDGVIEITTKDN